MKTPFFGIKMAIALTAGVSIIIGSAAFASSTGVGTIKKIIINSGGKAFFNHTGGRTGQPSCAIVPDRWVFDVTTLKGQAMLAFVMTAYSTGKQVQVYGTGSCPDWGDTETVEQIVTVDP